MSLDRVLESLLTSGPLAAVLGLAVWSLWVRLNRALDTIEDLHAEQRKFYEGLIRMTRKPQEEDEE